MRQTYSNFSMIPIPKSVNMNDATPTNATQYIKLIRSNTPNCENPYCLEIRRKTQKRIK